MVLVAAILYPDGGNWAHFHTFPFLVVVICPLLKDYAIKLKQEVLGRTNRLLSFDTIRTA
jgi:hypothetical protein